MNLTTKTLRNRLFERFPIVQFVLAQPDVSLTKRPIDMRWHYTGVVPISVSGFNPLGSQIFHGEHSYLERLTNTDLPIDAGEVDWFLYEAFFAAHDYMHIWAVKKLLTHFPNCTKIGMFSDDQNLADLAFILLVSEVVATVSLDWWMLSTVELSQELGINCQFRCLTTSFKMENINMARVISPAFSVQCISFFEWLTKGYCTGIFQGFHATNAATLQHYAPWLEKELTYGSKQRDLISRWIAFLGGRESRYAESIHFDVDTPIRIEALHWISAEVWNIFGGKRPESLSVNMKIAVPLPPTVPYLDFEFIDILHFTDEIETINGEAMPLKQFAYLTAQCLSHLHWSTKTSLTSISFDTIVKNRDLQSVLKMLRSCQHKHMISTLSPHLFIPN